MVEREALEVAAGRVHDEPEPVPGSLASLHDLVSLQNIAPPVLLPVRSGGPGSEVPCR